MPWPEALRNVRAFVFDLDGTLYQGEHALPGAVATVRALQQAGYAVCFATNTTSKSRRQLVEKLRRLGFEASADRVFSRPPWPVPSSARRALGLPAGTRGCTGGLRGRSAGRPSPGLCRGRRPGTGLDLRAAQPCVSSDSGTRGPSDRPGPHTLLADRRRASARCRTVHRRARICHGARGDDLR
nr:hypothetical protein [Rhodothermus marinus]